jgi:hypothetical protein
MMHHPLFNALAMILVLAGELLFFFFFVIIMRRKGFQANTTQHHIF